MAPHPNTKIWLALRSRLEDASPKPNYAYPGEVFSPTDEYVRVAFLPHPPVRVEISGKKKSLRRGLLALVLESPLRQAGEVSLGTAENIAELFLEDQIICYMDTCVQILTNPHVAGGFLDKGRWQTPITVSWQTYS